MSYLENLNQLLFLKINANPDTSPWMISVSAIIADDLIFIIPIFLLVLWLWGDELKRNTALKACAVTFLTLGLNQLIGMVYQHPRPLAIGLGHTFLPHAIDSSFPSDHMTVFISIGLALLFGHAKPLGWFTLLAGCLVAWSRVFLGVHFPFDMIGATLLSLMVYLLITPVWSMFGRQITRALIVIYQKIFALPISQGWIKR